MRWRVGLALRGSLPRSVRTPSGLPWLVIADRTRDDCAMWRSGTPILAVVTMVLLGGSAVSPTHALSQRPTRSMSLKAFVAVATAGVEGTFSATDRVSGRGRCSDGTVTVAQRAPAARSAWNDYKAGSWTYKVTTSCGSADELLVRRSELADCWRYTPNVPWTCTGPGPEALESGSIGYELATIPFFPGTALDGIRYAVSGASVLRHLAISTRRSTFGEVACLHVSASSTSETCLRLPSGRLASIAGADWIGYPWTHVTLTRLTAKVLPSQLHLSGKPKGSFRLPVLDFTGVRSS